LDINETHDLIFKNNEEEKKEEIQRSSSVTSISDAISDNYDMVS
jgi:hypothetical protein